jgi:hypothetical protein
MANIELDGVNKKIKVDSGDLTLDVPGDIVLDADGGDVVFADGGTNLLKVTNSSSDVVLQPQVDTKDIIFKQFDGTTVATVEDNGTFNVAANKLAINGTAITSTAAELNILDGVTATASELNLLDGGTSVGSSITLADADGFVVNDGGTMKTIPATDVATYTGGGGLVFIQQQTVSSNTNTINFNDAFSSTYDNYLFLFDATMGTNAAQLQMRFRSGSPTNDNYTGANTYRYAFTGGDSTGGSVSQSSNNSNAWTMGDGTYAAVNIDPPGVHGFIHFNSPIATNTQRTWSGTIVCYNNNDEQRAFSGGGRVVNNTVMTGFGFTASSGDINQFNGRLYGVVNS